ncbi:MAG: cobalt-precorrin-5B (C(1))-methyltransferase CbiD [Bacillota bacterium]|nr:cobalt-precorrin-5B (C(1))-methyltransferase CbiD [Bacillota bacterium]
MKKLELYINKDGEKLRCGYTTGSTATGAAKAAAIMLLTQKELSFVKIHTPAAIDLDLEVESAEIRPDYAIASVKKDSGDDPDATKEVEIFAKVSLRNDGEIFITGGPGVGKITQKGIYGDIGDYAINPAPRRMIEEELTDLGEDTGFNVEIFIPQGEEIAKKTFNANIGIKGGISIIGTKGIVYPMSEEAFLKSIYMEIDSIKLNSGTDQRLMLTPGNYGEEYAKKLDPNLKVVQVSNYVGKCLKYAYSIGFRNFFLLGHIGKFSKLALGAFNTHNEVVDLRMEAFVYYLALRGVDSDHLLKINSFLTAEEASKYIDQKGLDFVYGDMEAGAEVRIKKYLKDDQVQVKVKMYSMTRGILND